MTLRGPDNVFCYMATAIGGGAANEFISAAWYPSNYASATISMVIAVICLGVAIWRQEEKQ